MVGIDLLIICFDGPLQCVADLIAFIDDILLLVELDDIVIVKDRERVAIQDDQ